MKSIFVKRLQFTGITKDELLQQINENSFTLEAGEGIRIVEQDYTHIACHYLVETVFRQDTYNYETDEFEKVEYKRIERTLFFIDFDQQTLDIVGSKQQASKIIEFIGRITIYKMPISDAPINLIKLIESWKKDGVVFNVTKLKLADYPFFDSIIGNCILNLTGYPKSMDILRTYEKQIINVSLSVLLEEDSCTITFYKSGAISIYKDMEDIDLELIRLLKKGI